MSLLVHIVLAVIFSVKYINFSEKKHREKNSKPKLRSFYLAILCCFGFVFLKVYDHHLVVPIFGLYVHFEKVFPVNLLPKKRCFFKLTFFRGISLVHSFQKSVTPFKYILCVVFSGKTCEETLKPVTNVLIRYFSSPRFTKESVKDWGKMFRKKFGLESKDCWKQFLLNQMKHLYRSFRLNV